MSSAGVHHTGHHHSPGEGTTADRRRLVAALVLIAGLMAGEVTAGILASSLALLSDAAHMLTDALALALAVVAAGLAKRPAGGSFTFGLRRSEILSAQVNGATLAVLAVLILYGGVVRLVSAPAVDGTTMVAVALAGALVNLAAVQLLRPPGHTRSLNVEGAYRHVMSDLLAFVLTAAAGVVILVAGFRRADGIAALIIAAIMLRSAYALLRASGRVLLEASPEHVKPDEVGLAMAALPGVVEVHDLHVWELTSGFAALSAHVLVGHSTDCHATRAELERLLRDRFGVDHSTLQVEHAPSPLLKIE